MSESPRTARMIEPFAFWPQYASAMAGLGGDEGGPDPYYCFHTPYHGYEPGGLIFRVRLANARATRGELTVRVHGERANSGMEAVLVGHIRVPLEGLSGDHEFSIRVASIPGVIYALYGRYSQPSDLQIDDLVITVEELADEDANTYVPLDAQPSPFAPQNLETPSHLTLLGQPGLRAPVSQPYTPSQVVDETALSLPNELILEGSPLERWRLAYVWRVLDTYGLVQPGASGVLRGAMAASLRPALDQRRVLVASGSTPAGVAAHDFLVHMSTARDIADGDILSRSIMSGLAALRRGGLGVFVFDARLGGRSTVDPTAPTDAGWLAGEQDIQRIALKIIGHGSEVAQIVWPPERDDMPPAPFGLLLKR